MGFFSWKTKDSHKSIPNIFSGREPFRVYMRDNKGNVWVEDEYEGYGVFGGKDYYQLLAEMNECEGLTGDVDNDRSIGIDLAFSGKSYYSPVLLANDRDIEHIPSYWFTNEQETCEYQGFFYGELYEDEY